MPEGLSSWPSAKPLVPHFVTKSPATGAGVGEGVGVDIDVAVGVDVGADVDVGAAVRVAVGVGVGVRAGVGVAFEVGVGVEVGTGASTVVGLGDAARVGEGVGSDPPPQAVGRNAPTTRRRAQYRTVHMPAIITITSVNLYYIIQL